MREPWNRELELGFHCRDFRGQMNTVVADNALGAHTIRKIQWRILPLIFLLYIVSYLDRINVGFAALTMNKELGISSQQFGLLVGMFFFGYFLFEIPSNLLLHKIGARIWIARILVTWGFAAMLTGFVHNVHQLYFARFLLGLAEAGYFPGVILYLTYWFPQRERAQAVALVMVAIPVTSILGGPASGLILDHVHVFGLSSWRWLLILEGAPAVLCGLLAYYCLPNRPVDAKFLEADEKEWILAELASEEAKKLSEHQVSLVQTFTSLRVWHLAFIEFNYAIGLYSLSFWMPQVIQALSTRFSNTAVGFLTVIPQVVGLTAMILVSRSSDRHLERRYHAAVAALVAAIGWLLLGLSSSPVASMISLSLVAAGVYSIFGPFWALPSEFLSGYAAASGIAMINSIANLGGFAGPYAIGFIRNRTGSMRGGLVYVGASMMAAAVFFWLLPKRAKAQPR